LGAALTFYFKPDKPSFYITSGLTTKGYSYHKELYMDQYSVPSLMAMGGYRFAMHECTPEITDRLNLNAGAGFKVAKNHRLMLIWEVVLNFSVVKR
jgi:hypothetical protein